MSFRLLEPSSAADQGIQNHRAPVLSTNGRLPLIGVGAGAGGFSAVLAFVQNLPPDAGIAYLLVAPRTLRRQRLARLARATTLPIVEVKTPLTIQPDHIYVAAPDQLLQPVGNLLQPTPLANDGAALAPLDAFFDTLAAEQGAAAVAVLLAGRGVDGVAGLGLVKAGQGWTLAQDPDDAEQPALPRRALAAGVVDVSAPAAELAELIVKQVGVLADGAHGMAAKEPELDEALLPEILELVQSQIGYDFSAYKESMLLRRIIRRMQIGGYSELARYRDLLRTTPQQTRLLYKDCLVSVTNFFRDPDAFDLLERECVPQLFTGRADGETVRVWVAGCASGEEAYSLAILLSERAAQTANPPRIQIFATDVDEEALDIARRGLYPASIAEDLTPGRLEQYFVREEGGFRIKPQIREMVLFAAHNVLKDPPFSRLDLLCCRNLLIYLRPEAQARLLELFHYALNPEGYLFLGTAESANHATPLFTIRNKRCHLYQRHELPTPPRPLASVRTASQANRQLPAPARATPPPPPSLEELYRTWTLRRYAPPRLLVDEHADITHIFGGADRYLCEQEGAVTHNVLQKVLPELRLDLRAALYQAQMQGERSRTRWLPIEIEGARLQLQLEVGPVEEPGFPKNIVEVVFIEQAESSAAKLDGPEANETEVAPVDQLEGELLRSRQRLQTIMEEHQAAHQELTASNEELQSINEELKSTTEELEVNKEELQSMNEELETANQELKIKIDDLSRANSDLLNFISSTEVGVIFLDRGLRIKRYTPRATDLFYLIESDVERPFAHIVHRLRYSHLAERAAQVLETLEEAEVLVQSEDDLWFVVRLLPYRTVGNRVDGVVITFIDITDLKRAEHELQQRIQQQAVAELGRQALEESLLEPLFVSATEQVINVLDVEICQLLQLQPDGESLLLIAGSGWRAGTVGNVRVSTDPRFQSGYTLQIGGPVLLQDVHSEGRFAVADHLVEQGVVSGLTVLVPGPQRHYGVLGAYSRLPRTYTQAETSFLQAVANLLGAAIARREAEAQIHFQARLLDAVEQAVIATDQKFKIIYWNRYAELLYGWSAQEAIGRIPAEFIVGPDQQESVHPIRTQLRQGESWSGEFMMQRRNGDQFPVLVTNSPILNEEGERIGVVGISLDISERKRAEQALLESEAALRASEAEMRLVTNTVPGLIAFVDSRQRYQFVNVAYERWFDRPTADILGRSMAELLGPEVYQRKLSHIEAALSGLAVTFEDYIVYADGPRAVQINYVPDIEPDGQTVGFYSLITDISKRKHAEQILEFLAEASAALASSLDYERTLDTVAHLAVPVVADWCVIDLLTDDGRIEAVALVHVDPAMVALAYELRRRYPYDPDAPAGTPNVIRTGKSEFYPLITDEMLQAGARTAEDLELFRTIGYRSVMTVPLRARDRTFGTITFVSSESGRYFSDADLALAEDVARRAAVSIDNALLFRAVQHREQQLRISEERSHQQLAELQLIYDSAPVGLAVLDSDLRYLRLNNTLARMNGLPVAAHLGQTGTQLIPEVAKLVDERVEQVLVTGEPIVDLEVSGQTPAFPGEERIWLESFHPLRSPNGAIIGVNVVVQDITTRKQQEAELKAWNETLERRVEERTAELARSNRELDQFAYVASHDLKAPMRSISQLALWITEDAGDRLSETALSHLNRLRSRVQRMNAMLDDLLTYSRAGRMHHAPEKVDAATLIQGIVETLAPPADFVIHLPGSLPIFRTERVPLEIVLRNLIGNAIKHHNRPDGQVTITVEELDEWLEFIVSDDGPGIDPQYHQRIFELFQTLQPRDKVEGSGMGLAIVRRTVESRGGTITLISTPGNGAAFHFTWPKSID